MGQRGENVANGHPVFVAQDAEDQGGFGGGKMLFERRRQDLRAGSVVRAVEQKLLAGWPRDELQPPEPLKAGKASADAVLSDWNCWSEDADGGNGQRGVQALMLAEKGQFDCVQRSRLQLARGDDGNGGSIRWELISSMSRR